MTDRSNDHAALSRRAVLGAAAAGTAGLVVGRLTGPLFPPQAAPSLGSAAPSAAVATPTAVPTPMAVATHAGSHPFFGAHQGGISTPPQAHLQFVAFDMQEGTDRRDLVHLLRAWSKAAALLVEGLPVGATFGLGGDPSLPPEDTGEAVGLPPSGLTVTVGFGAGLFERDDVDRYGIAAARPRGLAPLPSFPGDVLDAARSDGDLCLQVCADDPTVALHAVRDLARIGARCARIRWSQSGFGLAAATAVTATVPATTPRNLMGFKDGTANIRGDDEAALDRHVWLADDVEPGWLAGGTYLVVRKIAILLEDWDDQPLEVQETTFGRTKESGAPLTGGGESRQPDLAAQTAGRDVIDRAAHVRLAHPSTNGGTRILRRGYSYFDGSTLDGHLDGGLLFISFQHDPSRFITLQQALGSDLLNEYIRPVGSGLFAVPRGATRGGFVGDTLLG